jgi:transcription elongation GreA/GreB family factor
MLTKAALKLQLIAHVEGELAAARAAHRAAVEGATHAEARPENDKDTRGLEQSYLARGHAQRVGELEHALAQLAAWEPRAFVDEPVTLGALVRVAEAGRERVFLLAGYGGGATLGDVTVLTPTAPLGRALLGRSADDDLELGARQLTILAID